MKNFIIAACLALSLIIILDTVDAGHALVMFVLAGIIPGTNIILGADQTLELFALLIGFTLSRITLFVLRQTTERRQLAY